MFEVMKPTIGYWLCPYCFEIFATDRYKYAENVVLLFGTHLKGYHPRLWRKVEGSRRRLWASLFAPGHPVWAN